LKHAGACCRCVLAKATYCPGINVFECDSRT
jgi:hypothetical protein